VVVGLLFSGIAALLALFALDYAGEVGGIGPGFSSVETTAVVVGGAVVLTAAISSILALGRAPASRSVARALGVVIGAAIVLLTLFTWGAQRDFDPSESTQASIHNRLTGLTDNHHEAFYLGDEVNGKRLASISTLDGVLFFDYGRCLDVVEGDCDRAISVTSQPTKTFGNRGETAEDCKSLPPVLGAPAAHIYADLLVFPGSSIVTIEYYRDAGNGDLAVDRRRTLSLGPQLRAVGQSTAAKTLPSPDARTQRFVHKHCMHPGH
jgi:hypothetical protein